LTKLFIEQYIQKSSLVKTTLIQIKLFKFQRTDRNQKELISQTNDVIVYSALITGLFLTSLLRSTTFYAMCMRSSVNLHNSIFYRLLRAPISVFDNNPVG
jgi:ABC-type bacteriocin/lantibiotic exporter with double-glycine peptidase domain